MKTRVDIGNTSLSSTYYRMRLRIEVEMKLLHIHVKPELMLCGLSCLSDITTCQLVLAFVSLDVESCVTWVK